MEKTNVTAPGAVPDEVFAMGRVTVGFGDGKSVSNDLKPLWNEQEKTLTSVTGEMVWDYGKETILLKSPKTQGVIGRAAGRAIDLPGVSVKLSTDFVSLLFTPLDDQPLATSKHVLITALSRDKQTGAVYSADGKKLENVGTAPLLLEPVQATLRFQGSKPLEVRATYSPRRPIESNWTPPRKLTATTSVAQPGTSLPEIRVLSRIYSA